MKRRGSIGLIIVMSLVITNILISQSFTYAKDNSSRKIIVFKQNVDNIKKDKILKKHSAIKIKDIKGTNAIVANISSDNDISKELDVKYVEDDVKITIAKKSKDDTSNDAKNSKKPSKKPKDEEPIPEQPDEIIPWGVEYMNAPEQWDITKGDLVKVGIIDTGIDLDHPDLMENIKGGYNAISKNKPYDDDNGHGTHVAGIIGAVDNEIGVVGVAPEADLYAVKALDTNGDGYISDVIEGIEWCIENDMDILNMSIGMTTDSVVLHETIIKAYNAGITMVAAAGNNYGGNCEYPAAYDEVIGVGAIDNNGSIANFSAKNGVDVWAPGKEIFSTYIGGDYGYMDGTSMATPHWISELINK